MRKFRPASGIVLPALVLLVAMPVSPVRPARAADTMPAPPDSAAVGAPVDTAFVPMTPPPPAPGEKRVYYGGSAALGFGNPDHVGIFPSIGYKLSRRVSIGGEIGYEYLKYDGIKEGFNNYGGSVFSRVKLTPRVYGHAEYQAISTELVSQGSDENDRAVVPYLLLGGGLIQPISANSSAYVEVLFDVLQDENSPYDSGEPFISFGVGVGF